MQTIGVTKIKIRDTCICVSPITGDVAISRAEYGTSVFNKDLQTMYQYKGPDQHKPSLGRMSYTTDAVYDNKGHLLIGAVPNNEVHICDATSGKLLKTINLTEYGFISCLAIQSDGTLVVGIGSYDGSNKLVYVKYI